MTIFRTRDVLVGQRTQIINAIRGHLSEYGLIAPQGPAHVERLIAKIEDPTSEVPQAARDCLAVLVGALRHAWQRLAVELAPMLGTLAGLRGRVSGASGRRPFRIGMGAALLSWWLSPRLPDLAAAFPDLAVEVIAWDGRPASVDTDLALLWIPRAAQRPGPCELAFPAETVFPVATPTLRRSHPGVEWRHLPPIAKSRSIDETGPEWSWMTWLGDVEARSPALRFRDIGGTLQAAIEGNGVALARSLLAGDTLRRRRLTRLVPRREMRPCSKIQVARWPDPADTTAAQLAAWLVAAARG